MAERRDRLRRACWVTILGGALALTIVAPPRPRLVWNASASAPLGLYAIAPGATPARGDRVIAWLLPRYRALAAARHYLPATVPLVKRVAAMPGDRVCARGGTVSVNRRIVATRRRRDPRGRVLPRWRGCLTLRDGAVLLLGEPPDSFDGRYFGPTRRADLVGTARLLWRW